MPRLAVLLAALVLLTPGVAAAEGPDAFTQALERGPVYAALAAWVGGLAVSLTPCVYPMIAVTVSVFGARQSKSRAEGALLSAAFVAGIVALMVPLGVSAGLSGSLFGSVLQSRAVIIAVSAVFLVMAAAMFGAFEFTLGSGLTNRLALVGGMGYRGAFLLGLVCGLVASPCTGPVLTGILLWIAKTQSWPLGALAMTAFGLGLGVPFFLVGAFAVQLPKSGRWMVHVKSVLGIVLVTAALWYLATTFRPLAALARPEPQFLGAVAVAVLIGLALGAVHRSFEEPGFGVKLAKGAGVLLVSVGAFLFLKGWGTPLRTLSWEKTSLQAARARASAEARPLLVDFTADWCGACQEIDRRTFSHPEVSAEAGRFVAIKVDATNDEDPAVVAAMGSLGVVGLPTVVMLDSRGVEVARFTDFVAPEAFLQALRRVD